MTYRGHALYTYFSALRQSVGSKQASGLEGACAVSSGGVWDVSSVLPPHGTLAPGPTSCHTCLVHMSQVPSVTAPWCERCGIASAVCAMRREMASAVDGMRRWAGGMACGGGMR